MSLSHLCFLGEFCTVNLISVTFRYVLSLLAWKHALLSCRSSFLWLQETIQTLYISIYLLKLPIIIITSRRGLFTLLLSSSLCCDERNQSSTWSLLLPSNLRRRILFWVLSVVIAIACIFQYGGGAGCALPRFRNCYIFLCGV